MSANFAFVGLKITKLAALQKHWHSDAHLESPKSLPWFETLITQSWLVPCLQVDVVAWFQDLGWAL